MSRRSRPALALSSRTSARTLRIGVVVVVLALLAGAAGIFWPRGTGNRVTAYFERAVGLYEGNDVRILGVRVGEVTSVTPQGKAVRVEMTYDPQYEVPADARAVVISPTLVSDRYVQLAPVYEDGPVLDDGATIPRSRTATPVELDRVYAALNDLSTALGPKGANADGSLSRLFRVGAKNLDGQGKNVHRTVSNLSEATQTLARGSDDLFSTVRNLQKFTSTLADSDDQVERFNQQLAAVSGQLEGEKDELAAALKNLSNALAEVEGFVRDNKKALEENVEDLTDVTGVLVKEQEALAEVLETAPLALSNLVLAYNPVSGTLDNRINFQQIQNPAMYLCSLVYSLGVSPSQCEPLLAPLNALRSEQLPVSLDLSFLTELTHNTEPFEGSFGGQRGQEEPGGGDGPPPGRTGGDAGSDNGSGSDNGNGSNSGGGNSGGQGSGAGGGSGERTGEGGGPAAPSPPEPVLGGDSGLEDLLMPSGGETGGQQ